MPSITARIARALLSVLPIYNGKGRLIDRSPMCRIRFKENLLDVRTSDDFTLRVWPNDLIGRHIYLTGHFDRCVVDALVRYSPVGGCLWDIGANIGYVSCAYLTRVPGSTVVAIEPLIEVAALLRHNLAQFRPERTNVVEAAVSDRVGVANIVRVAGNIGRSHIIENGSSGEAVALVTASSLVDICPPDIIKIDVEGHEAAVIRGITPALEKFRPAAVVFEHHTRGGAPDPEILQQFEALRYDVMRIGRRWNGWELAPYDRPLDGYEPSPDFVALRR